MDVNVNDEGEDIRIKKIVTEYYERLTEHYMKKSRCKVRLWYNDVLFKEAAIKEGEVVLDIGSGGGADVCIAAMFSGPSGKAIGVDISPTLVLESKRLASELGLSNVEFVIGDMEFLPLNENKVDLIISDCVINLAPNKVKVFKELHRVLKPGGRICLKDRVTVRPFNEDEKKDVKKWCKCIVGALTKEDYTTTLKKLGFTNINVRILSASREDLNVFDALIQGWKKSGL